MDFLNKFFGYLHDALTANGPDLLAFFMYLGLGMVLLGLFFYLKLCGVGSVKVYAELWFHPHRSNLLRILILAVRSVS